MVINKFLQMFYLKTRTVLYKFILRYISTVIYYTNFTKYNSIIKKNNIQLTEFLNGKLKENFLFKLVAKITKKFFSVA